METMNGISGRIIAFLSPAQHRGVGHSLENLSGIGFFKEGSFVAMFLAFESEQHHDPSAYPVQRAVDEKNGVEHVKCHVHQVL